MLVLTEAAAEAVKALTSTPQAPGSTRLPGAAGRRLETSVGFDIASLAIQVRCLRIRLPYRRHVVAVGIERSSLERLMAGGALGAGRPGIVRRSINHGQRDNGDDGGQEEEPSHDEHSGLRGKPAAVIQRSGSWAIMA